VENATFVLLFWDQLLDSVDNALTVVSLQPSGETIKYTVAKSLRLSGEVMSVVK
jgi:hypothetical protein